MTQRLITSGLLISQEINIFRKGLSEIAYIYSIFKHATSI